MPGLQMYSLVRPGYGASRCTIIRCPQKTPLKVYTTCFYFVVFFFSFFFFCSFLFCFSYTDIFGSKLCMWRCSTVFYYGISLLLLLSFLPSVRHALLEPGIRSGHFSTALQWTHTCGIIPSHPPTCTPSQNSATLKCLQWPNYWLVVTKVSAKIVYIVDIVYLGMDQL